MRKKTSLHQQRTSTFCRTVFLPFRAKCYQFCLRRDLHYIETDLHSQYMFADVLLQEHGAGARDITGRLKADLPDTEITSFEFIKGRPCCIIFLECTQRLLCEVLLSSPLLDHLLRELLQRSKLSYLVQQVPA